MSPAAQGGPGAKSAPGKGGSGKAGAVKGGSGKAGAGKGGGGAQAGRSGAGSGQGAAGSRAARQAAEAVKGSAAISAGSAPEPPRLKVRYNTEVRAALGASLGLPNVMQVPRFEKIVLNMGVGRATQQQSLLEGAVRDLRTITGQKPQVTRARKSVAAFKLREGNAIGAKVTLRGDRMWEFFDRLVSLAIPRMRDFRGLPANSFDGAGNYTFGVTEQLIFPEVSYDQVDVTRGMHITIVTTAKSDAEGRALLAAFGFPFRREVQS